MGGCVGVVCVTCVCVSVGGWVRVRVFLRVGVWLCAWYVCVAHQRDSTEGSKVNVRIVRVGVCVFFFILW